MKLTADELGLSILSCKSDASHWTNAIIMISIEQKTPFRSQDIEVVVQASFWSDTKNQSSDSWGDRLS